MQGMQGHRLSGCPPPRMLLFPAGKPVARSSHSPLLGQRGIEAFPLGYLQLGCRGAGCAGGPAQLFAQELSKQQMASGG